MHSLSPSSPWRPLPGQEMVTAGYVCVCVMCFQNKELAVATHISCSIFISESEDPSCAPCPLTQLSEETDNSYNSLTTDTWPVLYNTYLFRSFKFKIASNKAYSSLMKTKCIATISTRPNMNTFFFKVGPKKENLTPKITYGPQRCTLQPLKHKWR